MKLVSSPLFATSVLTCFWSKIQVLHTLGIKSMLLRFRKQLYKVLRKHTLHMHVRYLLIKYETVTYMLFFKCNKVAICP